MQLLKVMSKLTIHLSFLLHRQVHLSPRPDSSAHYVNRPSLFSCLCFQILPVPGLDCPSSYTVGLTSWTYLHSPQHTHFLTWGLHLPQGLPITPKTRSPAFAWPLWSSLSYASLSSATSPLEPHCPHPHRELHLSNTTGVSHSMK